MRDILGGLEIDAERLVVCTARSSQRLELGTPRTPLLHWCIRGRGRIVFADGSAVPLGRGTLAVAPKGLNHRLEGTSDPNSSCELQVVCGAIGARFREAFCLFDYLTEPVVEEFEADHSLHTIFAVVLEEVGAPKPGSEAMLQSLIRQCIVLLLRRQCDAGRCTVPWIVALEHPSLAGAVSEMMERPEAPHTVESLAEAAGMSRSSFAEKFRSTFACGPMELLRDIRIRRAEKLLRDPDIPVKAIAARIGFQSRSHFTEAFKSARGLTPAAYRQSLQRD